jgi:starvation-inducible DNA-binding protein
MRPGLQPKASALTDPGTTTRSRRANAGAHDRSAHASHGEVAVNTVEHPQAEALDGALADLLDLGLLAKQARWNVVGPRFPALQQLLDELADLARASSDRVSERAVVLGHAADGRAATIITLSSLPTLEPGVQNDADTITAFLAILDAVVSRIHSVFEAFDTDLVTVDLFTSLLAEVEKYAWMLRAQREH